MNYSLGSTFFIDMIDTAKILELPNSCETQKICRQGSVPQKHSNSQIKVVLCYCLIAENGQAI